MNKQEIFESILNILNEVYQADGKAMSQLCESRVPCNETLAEHPTVVVQDDDDGQITVGLIGIINGICEKLTGLKVAGEYNVNDNLVSFVPYSANDKNLDTHKPTKYNAIDNPISIEDFSKFHWKVNEMLCEKFGVDESGHCPVDFSLHDRTNGEFSPDFTFSNMQWLLERLGRAKRTSNNDPQLNMAKKKYAYEQIEKAIQEDIRTLTVMLGWVHDKFESRTKLLEYMKEEQDK